MRALASRVRWQRSRSSHRLKQNSETPPPYPPRKGEGLGGVFRWRCAGSTACALCCAERSLLEGLRDLLLLVFALIQELEELDAFTHAALHHFPIAHHFAG